MSEQDLLEPALSHTPPSRRDLRAALLPFAGRSTPIALAWFFVDWALFVGGSVVVVLVESLWLKTIGAVVIWLAIARLFIIGHDACHQALTDHRRLNRLLGRLAFLPSLTPYSLWDVGHNLAHHAFTNLRGMDGVWVPLSPQEFQALSPLHQRLERLYRCGWGPGFYYLIELWWKKLIAMGWREGNPARPQYRPDVLLVGAFGLAWLATLVLAAQATGQSVALALLFAFAIPFALWNGLMGFVIYVHHTDPQVRWFADRAQWTRAAPYLQATIHITVPRWFDRLLHNILQHPAHHLDMSIPFYRLPAAQAKLSQLAPQHVVVRRFCWADYWTTARACKVYDYESGRWCAFPR